MSAKIPTQTLDLTGYRCPVPVIRLEAALRKMPHISRFIVYTDDPIASVDIPFFCQEAGHQAHRLDPTSEESPPKRPIGDDFCVFEVTRDAIPRKI